MARHQKSKARKVISTIFAFIISMLTFIITLLTVFQLTAMSPDYMIKQMDRTNYYSKLTSEIENQFATLGGATGFDETFFKGCLNQYMVSEHINQHVYTFYGNSETKVDTANLEADLLAKFYVYADSKGAERTPELDEGLTYLAQHCRTMYDKLIYTSYLDMLSSAIQKLEFIVPIGIAVMGIMIIVLTITMFGINPFKHQALRGLIYALSGGGLMVLGLPLIVLISNKASHIAIAGQAMFELVVGYVNNVMLVMILTVFAYVLLVLILGVIYTHGKKKALGE